MPKKILLLFIFSILVLWQLLCISHPGLRFVLPPPSSIFFTLYELKARFAFHSWVTLKEMLIGFSLALCIGSPLAWLMFRFKTMRSLLQPCFVLIQCIPMFTLAPLMVIWVGWGMTAIILPTALMIFFPLTLNLYQGLKETPTAWVEFFELCGATSWQTLIKLRLPAATAHIFSGLRLSAAIAGIGAVAGEWAGAQQGLGILMLESRRNSDLDITFAALFCLCLITLSFYTLVSLAESWFRKKRRLNPKVLVLLIMCLSMASCKPKAQTTLLLDWLPNPNHIPLYVGLELGYFSQEGIELKIQKLFDNGSGISYLTNHKVDLALCHLPGLLKACSLGANLHIIGVLIPVPLRAFIYRADLNVTSANQLKGYSLGYCIGGPDTTFLEYLLQQADIVPGNRKNVSADLIAAMGTQAVDFIYGGFWNIEPYHLDSLEVKTKYFPIEQFGVPSYQELIIVGCTPPSDLTQRFKKALEKSIIFCKQHPDAAFDYYLIHTPDKSEQTKAWEKKAWKKTVSLLPETQTIDMNQIEKFYQWQLSQQILKKSFDISTLISLAL